MQKIYERESAPKLITLVFSHECTQQRLEIYADSSATIFLRGVVAIARLAIALAVVVGMASREA